MNLKNKILLIMISGYLLILILGLSLFYINYRANIERQQFEEMQKLEKSFYAFVKENIKSLESFKINFH